MITLTDQDINDIFATAIEGGINYWAGIDFDKMDFRKSVATIYDKESGDFWELNPDVINRGLNKYLSDGFLVRLYPEFTYEDWMENAPDAGDVDIIVQLGLFGEVVFG